MFWGITLPFFFFLEVIIDGSITTQNGINGYNITEINKSAIGLEKNNFIEGELIFEVIIDSTFLIAIISFAS